MTCNCICDCTHVANPSGDPTTMCSDCQFMNELCSDGHQLPNPAVKVEHVEYAPLTEAQRDRVWAKVLAEHGL